MNIGHLDAQFWEQRYKEGNTGWDLGEISPPLKAYFDQLENKELRILIPGAGNAYEAEYLSNIGFNKIYVLDWSEMALGNLKKRSSKITEDQLIIEDFFEHHSKYDLIIEQTFFCAIEPGMRRKYAEKISELLLDKGKLVGLLFNIPLYTDHPPFGGNKNEYISIFNDYFNIIKMETAYNSHPARAGNELFINLEKKSESERDK